MPDTVTVHHRMQPAPEQQYFPSRRRSTRQRTSLPPLPTKQSTLTQLDFVASSSSPHSIKHDRSTLSVSTNTDDDDSDFAEPRPKKKQKTKEPTPGGKQKSKRQPCRDQSTMTQCWRQQAYVKESDESDEDFAALVASSDQGEYSTWPTTAGTDVNPRTPQKDRRPIIPSSQTPSSIKLSMSDQHGAESNGQSPLKERSTNASVLNQSQPGTSPKAAPIISKHVDFEMATEDGPTRTVSHPSWMAELTYTPKKQRDRVERTFKRTNTIQDSEEGDIELSSPSRPLRVLNRTTTVQESQLDSDLVELDAMTDDERENHENEDDDNETRKETSSTYYSLMRQSTFNPVMAALDRDASRFGKTSTQLQTQLQTRTQVRLCPLTGTESKPQVPAGADGLRRTDSNETEIVVSSQLERPRCAPSPELGESPVKIVKIEQIEQVAQEKIPSSQPDDRQCSSDIDQAMASASIPGKNYLKNGVEYLVGSNMPTSQASHVVHTGDTSAFKIGAQTSCHPSQVSTVEPSQLSRPASAHEDLPTSSSSSPPQMPAPRLPETLTSSPFPLPPWTGADGSITRNHETQGTLVDFSLPPPPSLISSSSR